MQSCCSPIASASAAAPRHAIARSVSTAAELPACIRFSCCTPLASASAAALDCVRFNCFPIASSSAAAPRLCPLQLCSPMASASSASPRLRPLQLLFPDCVGFGSAPCQLFWKFQPCPLFSNILRRVRGSVN